MWFSWTPSAELNKINKDKNLSAELNKKFKCRTKQNKQRQKFKSKVNVVLSKEEVRQGGE